MPETDNNYYSNIYTSEKERLTAEMLATSDFGYLSDCELNEIETAALKAAFKAAIVE